MGHSGSQLFGIQVEVPYRLINRDQIRSDSGTDRQFSNVVRNNTLVKSLISKDERDQPFLFSVPVKKSLVLEPLCLCLVLPSRSLHCPFMVFVVLSARSEALYSFNLKLVFIVSRSRRSVIDFDYFYL